MQIVDNRRFEKQLEQRVRNSEALIVEDRNRSNCAINAVNDLDAEEESLVAAGLIRLPLEENRTRVIAQRHLFLI